MSKTMSMQFFFFFFFFFGGGGGGVKEVYYGICASSELLSFSLFIKNLNWLTIKNCSLEVNSARPLSKMTVLRVSSMTRYY